MTVHILFWFDVEDYITPQSDIALGRLVDIFDRHEAKATFKLVAEKVRSLRRGGHDDILAKLLPHAIGYHTDSHSRPPSISEQLVGLGWPEGIEAFIEREQDGLETLRHIFGRVPTCYGQPGGAWAPQVYPALRRWGIPAYLDAGPWVDLDHKPHRYCDTLNILDVDGLMHIGIGGGADEVLKRQTQLARIVDRLRPSGGIVSLFAHECEFVTAQFWDAINFGGGQDTPRDQWQPALLVDEAESEARYAAMDNFLAFAGNLPGVEISTAADLPRLFPDRAKGHPFSAREVADLTAHCADQITHQQIDDTWLSPAEIFALTVRLLAQRARTGRWPAQVLYRYVDGPPAPPFAQFNSPKVENLQEGRCLALDDLFGTCLYEDAALDQNGHLPAEVQIGRTWLSPADFLTTVGAALPGWLDGGTDDAPIQSGDLASARHVPDHVGWNWIIFAPGFNGDPLLELGKLQAWTLKPAMLNK